MKIEGCDVMNRDTPAEQVLLKQKLRTSQAQHTTTSLAIDHGRLRLSRLHVRETADAVTEFYNAKSRGQNSGFGCSDLSFGSEAERS
jgi:hypothetical protein